MMDAPTMESKTSYSLAVVGVASALIVLFAGASVILAVGHSVPLELWSAAGALSGALVGILIPATHTAAAADDLASGAGLTKASAAGAARSTVAQIAAGAGPAEVTQAARTALANIKSQSVDVKVQALRAGSTSGEVIDGVIGMFGKLADDAQSALQGAQTKATDAQTKVQELQAAAATPDEVQAAQAALEAAQSKVAPARAAYEVSSAAAGAAKDTRDTATDVAAPGTPTQTAPPTLTTPAITLMIVAGVVLVLTFALAILIAKGTIHGANCPLALAKEGKQSACDSNLLQVGTALLTLGSAAGGTLLGLLATPDGKSAGSVTAK